MLTRSRPPAGVQRTPVWRLTEPSATGALGAGAGGGTATAPRSLHAVQPFAAVHSLNSSPPPPRATIHSCSGPSAAVAGDESMGVGSSGNQGLNPAGVQYI